MNEVKFVPKGTEQNGQRSKQGRLRNKKQNVEIDEMQNMIKTLSGHNQEIMKYVQNKGKMEEQTPRTNERCWKGV